MGNSPEKHDSAYDSPTGGNEEQIAVSKTRRNHLFSRCCGGCAALTVIIIIVTVVLIFTVFKSKQPVVRINKYYVVKYEFINGTNTPRPGSNATVIVDVSMKNRNFVSFTHPLIASTIHYRGAVIGERRTPPGTQMARRTLRTNITVECIVDRIIRIPGLGSDMKSGVFNVSSYSPFAGRVKFLFMKKHVKVKVNCDASINATSMTLLRLKCKQKFKLS